MSLAGSLRKIWGSEIMEDLPLAPLSTMGVGGKAELYFEPRKIEDFIQAKKICKESGSGLRVIGGGSNIIIDDEGVHGLVVSTRSLRSLKSSIKGRELSIIADSGIELRKIIGITIKEGFTGIEFAIGIPGTVGGALFGNAGIMGHAISDVVDWIDIVNERGCLIRRDAGEIDWGYRHSGLATMDGIVVRCKLLLTAAPRKDIISSSRFFWNKRTNQPYKFRSAGCIFKNPPGDSAGRLLDEAGCKGLKKGNAKVSEIHANFIINLGGATFEDIVWLIEACKEKVKNCFGIKLNLEVHIFSDTVSKI